MAAHDTRLAAAWAFFTLAVLVYLLRHGAQPGSWLAASGRRGPGHDGEGLLAAHCWLGLR
jgi:thiamine monophosphate kinase